MRRVLSAHDAEGAGSLERRVFRNAIHKVLPGHDARDIDRLAAKYDRESTGRVSIQAFLDGLLEFRRYHPVKQNFKNWKTPQFDGLFDIDGAKWNLDDIDA